MYGVDICISVYLKGWLIALLSASGPGASEVACAALLWDRLLTPERAAMPFYAEFAALAAASPHADNTRLAAPSAVQSAGPTQQPGELSCHHVEQGSGHLYVATCRLPLLHFR